MKKLVCTIGVLLALIVIVSCSKDNEDEVDLSPKTVQKRLVKILQETSYSRDSVCYKYDIEGRLIEEKENFDHVQTEKYYRYEGDRVMVISKYGSSSVSNSIMSLNRNGVLMKTDFGFAKVFYTYDDDGYLTNEKLVLENNDLYYNYDYTWENGNMIMYSSEKNSFETKVSNTFRFGYSKLPVNVPDNVRLLCGNFDLCVTPYKNRNSKYLHGSAFNNDFYAKLDWTLDADGYPISLLANDNVENSGNWCKTTFFWETVSE